ncbi:phage holin, lambda family [Salmonella enterica]|uniref:Phage holin, lambda family n=1 Tax=Salmonella enterica TaxID=28901 RepID=A0A2T8TDI4_SALER|nr:phage holin, lambda family [Salmonella enterica]EAC2145630.1 phage holin, lambda family [Salmonella enterica subsp. enterica]EBV5771881.1 phage holin, lambda family [Salmonella enterica subsp. enterica serovar Monophasic]EBZ3093583.1 phage holin, lambda family [Salmonella enterica subsp. enterica serovar Weltevreden]ECD1585277.1 phage holin, lambda family [Salmonella enterica subsp. enterica serovar Typhimurium]ECT8741095.1 phage holin, lambda family [Salmonella enterica subsp. enterica ser
MKMHFDPHSWDSWIELFQSWWRGDVPIGGVVMAIVVAFFRMVYNGSSWKETLFEGLLCGSLTLTAVSALDYFDVPKSLTIAIGGTIGFIGVKKISTIISTYFSNRFGGGTPPQV